MKHFERVLACLKEDQGLNIFSSDGSREELQKKEGFFFNHLWIFNLKFDLTGVWTALKNEKILHCVFARDYLIAVFSVFFIVSQIFFEFIHQDGFDSQGVCQFQMKGVEKKLFFLNNVFFVFLHVFIIFPPLF